MFNILYVFILFVFVFVDVIVCFGVLIFVDLNEKCGFVYDDVWYGVIECVFDCECGC